MVTPLGPQLVARGLELLRASRRLDRNLRLASLPWVRSKIPWNAERFFQWRKWKDYGSGVAGISLSTFSAARISSPAHGPTRAMANGAIRYWKDGRDADDVLLALFDYPEGFNLSLP